MFLPPSRAQTNTAKIAAEMTTPKKKHYCCPKQND